MIDEHLDRIARVPVLLVATDYDGTLAPIVEDPAAARPHREAMVALQNLAQLPQTHAVIISGRSLSDLAQMTGEPAGVHLVGSHGSEFDPGFAQSLSAEQGRLRGEVVRGLREIASRDAGFLVEEKPASIAFHYRNVEASAGERACEDVLAGVGSLPGVHVRTGKMVVELAVVETNKGEALETIRRRVGASAAVFLGDDVTDEDAFATLQGPDVGVKVGSGESRAAFRVGDTEEVARVLARVCEARCAWLEGDRATPIEQHSMLSDQRSIALVTPRGSVTWWCAPRIDSPALFAALLGGPAAGWFGVAPVGDDREPDQEYEEGSLVLRTRWESMEITDYLDCSGSRPTQRPGRSDLVRVISGKGKARITFSPRLDFGRTPTQIAVHENGLVVEDSHDPIVLRAPGLTWDISDEGSHERATCEVDLSAGPVVLELRYGSHNLGEPVVPEAERRKRTSSYWSTWANALELPDLQRDLVKRSALAIKGLCFGPTGAIAAAGTTSLPEHLGGVRNWDYRYCWPRDAAMAAQALARLGSTDEGVALLDWCLDVVDRLDSAERMHPLYTVMGHELGTEGEIGELNGYAGSRPVRVGNAASHQVQLDVFGPILDLMHELSERGAALSGDHWRLVESIVDAVARRWNEPDHGIWEVRMARRHHVHSRTMCWLTVDRAIKLAQRQTGREPEGWSELRDNIRDDVLEHGFCAELKSFGTAYGCDDLDAAVLHVGLSGMLDPGDDRFVSTVDAVERGLREGPVVYRYRFDDGLPGEEGGFHICTSWLIESLAMIGRDREARDLLDQMCGLAGRTGLLSEEHDPGLGRALGNHPQAYSHLGVINAALRLDQGERSG